MEIKQKLEITENTIIEARKHLRKISRNLENIKHHKETHHLFDEFNLEDINNLENLLYEIELKINDKIVFDL